MRGFPLFILTWFALSPPPVWTQNSSASPPRFEDYPIVEKYVGLPVEPILSTAELRRYRTRIRDGVLGGSGVPTGSRLGQNKVAAPNFAGHYFVIRWGCGSQCVMMATVDATTGIVYDPPLSDKGSLYVPLDNLSRMEIDLRSSSSLLVLRNACQDFKRRDSCGTYYFNWKEHRWLLVKFTTRTLSRPSPSPVPEGTTRRKEWR